MEKLDLGIITKTMENLRKNNMTPFFIERKEDVVELVKDLVCEGSTVSNGGSVTLSQCGVTELLGSQFYNLIDRSKATNDEEMRIKYIEAFDADAYFCSSNAVTSHGELYNVDGNSNRVASILYGPRQVIIIIGYNKIVEGIGDAVLRVKRICAPAICEERKRETYCAKLGHCISLDMDNPSISDGCSSGDRVCCNYVISARQRIKNRIKIIIVGEVLGL